jgi:hypothetical protein
MEINSASLREIVKKKYSRNTVEIDFASPACGRPTYRRQAGFVKYEFDVFHRASSVYFHSISTLFPLYFPLLFSQMILS